MHYVFFLLSKALKKQILPQLQDKRPFENKENQILQISSKIKSRFYKVHSLKQEMKASVIQKNQQKNQVAVQNKQIENQLQKTFHQYVNKCFIDQKMEGNDIKEKDSIKSNNRSSIYKQKLLQNINSSNEAYSKIQFQNKLSLINKIGKVSIQNSNQQKFRRRNLSLDFRKLSILGEQKKIIIKNQKIMCPVQNKSQKSNFFGFYRVVQLNLDNFNENVQKLTSKQPKLHKSRSEEGFNSEIYSNYKSLNRSKCRFFQKYHQKFHYFQTLCEQTADYSKRFQQITNIKNSSNLQIKQTRAFLQQNQMQMLQKRFLSQLSQIKNCQTQKVYNIEHFKQNLIDQISEIKNLIKNYKNSPTISLDELAKRSQKIQDTIRKKISQFSSSQILKINSNLMTIQQTFSEWFQGFNKNKECLFQMVTQIQKLPEAFIVMFGIQQNSQQNDKMEKQKILNKKFEEFLLADCQKCFDRDEKFRRIGFLSSKMRSIIKNFHLIVKTFDR